MCDLRKSPEVPAITRGKVRGEQDHGPDRTEEHALPHDRGRQAEVTRWKSALRRYRERE